MWVSNERSSLRSFQTALAFKSSQIVLFYTRHRRPLSRMQRRWAPMHRGLCAAFKRCDIAREHRHVSFHELFPAASGFTRSKKSLNLCGQCLTRLDSTVRMPRAQRIVSKTATTVLRNMTTRKNTVMLTTTPDHCLSRPSVLRLLLEDGPFRSWVPGPRVPVLSIALGITSTTFLSC